MAHTTEATGARGTRDPRGASRRASLSTVEGRRRASHAWTPQTRERGPAGAHGTSPAHARVCHRAHRPRLPTTYREALRERRTPTWRLQDRSRVW